MKEAETDILQATGSVHDRCLPQIQYHWVPWLQIAIQIYSPENINQKHTIRDIEHNHIMRIKLIHIQNKNFNN